MSHSEIDCQEQFDYIMSNIEENDTDLFNEWSSALFVEMDEDQLDQLWKAYTEMMEYCYGGSD